MLRNLNQSSGGRRICGIVKVGVLASEIPTGFTIPSLLANDVSGGDPAGTLYRVKVIDYPVDPANLRVFENGSFIFTGPDGTYSGSQLVYKTGVPQTPNGTYTINVGAGITATVNIAEFADTLVAVSQVYVVGSGGISEASDALASTSSAYVVVSANIAELSDSLASTAITVALSPIAASLNRNELGDTLNSYMTTIVFNGFVPHSWRVSVV